MMMTMMMMMVTAIHIKNILKCLVGAINLESRRWNEKVKLKHKTQQAMKDVMNGSKTPKTANNTIIEAR